MVISCVYSSCASSDFLAIKYPLAAYQHITIRNLNKTNSQQFVP
jgi:hypothetical protein